MSPSALMKPFSNGLFNIQTVVTLLYWTVKIRLCMWQLFTHTTLHTIRLPVSVSMGTSNWDFTPQIVSETHRPIFGAFMWQSRYAAIGIIGTKSVFLFVLLLEISMRKPGITLVLHGHDRDKAACIPHHRLVLSLWWKAVWSLLPVRDQIWWWRPGIMSLF